MYIYIYIYIYLLVVLNQVLYRVPNLPDFRPSRTITSQMNFSKTKKLNLTNTEKKKFPPLLLNLGGMCQTSPPNPPKSPNIFVVIWGFGGARGGPARQIQK